MSATRCRLPSRESPPARRRPLFLRAKSAGRRPRESATKQSTRRLASGITSPRLAHLLTNSGRPKVRLTCARHAVAIRALRRVSRKGHLCARPFSTSSLTRGRLCAEDDRAKKCQSRGLCNCRVTSPGPPLFPDAASLLTSLIFVSSSGVWPFIVVPGVSPLASGPPLSPSSLSPPPFACSVASFAPVTLLLPCS